MAPHQPLPRRWCSELVSIVCRQDDGRLLKISGNLEEIGESSALILTDSAIRTGTKVVVTCQTHELKGVVASRSFDEHLGFFVEIRLDSGCQWSQRWFTPEHLLPHFRVPPKVFHLGNISVTEEILQANSARLM
jgi:hypothetical protein